VYDKTDKDNRHYKSLTRSMVVTIILVSVMPLLVILGITRHFFQVSFREKACVHLESVVSSKQQAIEVFFQDRLATMQVIANTATFPQLTQTGFLKQALAAMEREYGPSVKSLGVVDDRGVLVAYAGPGVGKDADFSQAPWFRMAMGRDDSVSDVLRNDQGASHVILAVRHEQSGKKWLLKAALDTEPLRNLLSSLRIGKTGAAFILNREEQVQATNIQDSVPSPLPLSVLGSSERPPGDVAIVEKADAAGNEFLYVMAQIKNPGWVLVFRQSVDEAFSELYEARRLTASAFLIGVVVIVLMAVLLSRRTVRLIAEADQEKSSMNDQLIETGKLASLGELAAGIAHEINNPVAVMVEEAGWMRDLVEDEDLSQPDTLEEFKRCLSKIQTQGRRCKDITHKLLSFARKTDHAVKTVQLNDIIEEVAGLSDQRAVHNKVRIQTSLEENLPIVHVSPSEVQQVLLNLLNNSFDAMDEKGGTIEISSRTSAPYAEVEISDTGPGIPDDVMPRIFDPFFTTKPVGKGTGLGLSICYGIIKKMGGEIRVTSAEGQGTTFHLLFPLADREQEKN
jgi:two-component system, NtrC family, sensor kinase